MNDDWHEKKTRNAYERHAHEMWMKTNCVYDAVWFMNGNSLYHQRKEILSIDTKFSGDLFISFAFSVALFVSCNFQFILSMNDRWIDLTRSVHWIINPNVLYARISHLVKRKYVGGWRDGTVENKYFVLFCFLFSFHWENDFDNSNFKSFAEHVFYSY